MLYAYNYWHLHTKHWSKHYKTILVHAYSFRALQWYQECAMGSHGLVDLKLANKQTAAHVGQHLKKPCFFIFSMIQPSIFKSLLIPSWWAHEHSKPEFQRGVVHVTKIIINLGPTFTPPKCHPSKHCSIPPLV